MAKKTVIKVIDDIDGAELDSDNYETVRWSIDGKQYEFDSSPANAEAFRDHVATYVAASRSVRAADRQRRTGAAKNSSSNPQKVRAWAAENGISVSDRGRIPADIQDQYDAAH